MSAMAPLLFIKDDLPVTHPRQQDSCQYWGPSEGFVLGIRALEPPQNSSVSLATTTYGSIPVRSHERPSAPKLWHFCRRNVQPTSYSFFFTKFSMARDAIRLIKKGKWANCNRLQGNQLGIGGFRPRGFALSDTRSTLTTNA